jgi:MtN3 and saliva related transmembrane protein
MTEIIGFIAAFCTTISFLPQVIRIFRSKNTESISLSMYSIFVFGVILWLVYGIILENVPIIIANIITLALAASILVMKIRDIMRRSQP